MDEKIIAQLKEMIARLERSFKDLTYRLNTHTHSGSDLTKTLFNDRIFGQVKSVSAAYTLDVSDTTLLCTATGGAFTVALPPAAQLKWRIFNVKKVDASANAVTIDPFGSETIDGAATLAVGTQYESAMFQSDGSNWHVL